MKLPIKDKFFKEIKAGKKRFDIRDAHITFVNEKTGEKLRKEIMTTGIGKKQDVLTMTKETEEGLEGLIEDENLIYFYWD